MRYIIPVLVTLFIGVSLGQLIGCTKLGKLVPVDNQNTGAQQEYQHGPHCIDMRAF